METFVRLSEDALHQRHETSCKRFQAGHKHCDCLVGVVIALQAELDGRFGWRMTPDPFVRNAVTVLTPDRKKLRLTEYPDGRLRLKVVQGSPLLLQDMSLTGRGTDAIVVLVPEGWIRPPEMVRTDYVIIYLETPGGPTLYFPRRYRPDLPIGQQWETTRKRARHFSTAEGAKQVMTELSTQVPPASLSVMPVQVNTSSEEGA